MAVKKSIEEMKEDDAPPWMSLWDVELKLKGIAYLIESQGSDPCPPHSEDQEDIHRGIGLVLSELSLDVADIRRKLESRELKGAKQNKRKTQKRKT